MVAEIALDSTESPGVSCIVVGDTDWVDREEEEGGQLVYEVQKSVDGIEYEIEVTADGEVLEIEEGDDDSWWKFWD